MESYKLLLDQETLYWNSRLKDKQWYRKILGGKWRFLKFGKDTPYIGMFCMWTKMPDDCFEGYFEILCTEQYDFTGVDTKWKLYKAMINAVVTNVVKVLV